MSSVRQPVDFISVTVLILEITSGLVASVWRISPEFYLYNFGFSLLIHLIYFSYCLLFLIYSPSFFVVTTCRVFVLVQLDPVLPMLSILILVLVFEIFLQ